MIIGITGNSGAGKTTVSLMLAEKLNAKLIDADMIVKEEQKIGKQYYKKIVEAFGGEILLKNHEINRKKLANIIYNNLEKRNVINNITMEYIVPIIIEQAKSTEEENVIIDVPLLFEMGLNEICEFTIAVVADKDIRIERLKNRENCEEKIIKERISAQNKDEYYLDKVDYIIQNNDNELEKKIEEICRKMQKI